MAIHSWMPFMAIVGCLSVVTFVLIQDEWSSKFCFSVLGRFLRRCFLVQRSSQGKCGRVPSYLRCVSSLRSPLCSRSSVFVTSVGGQGYEASPKATKHFSGWHGGWNGCPRTVTAVLVVGSLSCKESHLHKIQVVFLQSSR